MATLKKRSPQSFEFGESRTQDEFDFGGDSISGNATTYPVVDGGSTPTSPLHTSDLKRAVNP